MTGGHNRTDSTEVRRRKSFNCELRHRRLLFFFFLIHSAFKFKGCPEWGPRGAASPGGTRHSFASLRDLGRGIATAGGAARGGCGRTWPAIPGVPGKGGAGRTVTLSPKGPGEGAAATPTLRRLGLGGRPPPSPPRPGDPAPFAPRRPLPGRAPERAALLTGARAGSCRGRLAAAGLLARAAPAPPSCSGA